jgi:hypothetical protein
MFGGFVQPVVGLGDAPLACVFIGAKRRCGREKQSNCERGSREPRPYPK